MEKLWWINPDMVLLVAQDGNLDQRDLRVLMALMSLAHHGPVEISQQRLADLIDYDRADVGKSLRWLLQCGYIHKEGKAYGIDQSLMFEGRRNQKQKKMRLHLNEIIRERRRLFYEKVARNGPDNSLGWPGYHPDGGRFDATGRKGWRFYGSAHKETKDPEGSN